MTQTGPMDREPAAAHLSAELEETLVSAPRRALRWIGALASAALGDGIDAPDVDLVVRRRESGAEVLRTHADMGSPELLLARVRADLEEKTVEEFVVEWRILPRDDAS